MALPRTQTKPKSIQKQKSFKDFFNTGKKKAIALGGVLVIAAIGAYLMFFVGAAPNNCSAVDGGGICDVNQASSPDGADAVASTTDEVQNLSRNAGWTDWGVPFRAPNFPQNGALPVWRFYRNDITAHFLVIEGSAEYNTMVADPANAREGIAFYAWPDGRQPGTTPIHRINRKPLWFLQMYTDNQNVVNQFVANPDGSWQDGGVNFWAYPSTYFPPVPASTPTKDTDCANQNLTPGDKGACVQWHKGVLNGYVVYNGNQAPQLDVNNNDFDSTTNDYTRLFVKSLQSKGVKVPDYSNVLTKEIWEAFAAGYPAAPVTRPNPTTPGVPNVPSTPQPKDPGKTDTLPSGPTQPVGTDNKPPQPSQPIAGPDSGVGCTTANAGEALTHKGRNAAGEQYSKACITTLQVWAGLRGADADGIWGPKTEFAITAKLKQNQPRNPGAIPNRNPDDRSTQSNDSKNPQPSTPAPRPDPDTRSPQNAPTGRLGNGTKQHLNIYVDASDKVVSNSGSWTRHYICDVYVNDKVWKYARDDSGKDLTSSFLKVKQGTGRFAATKTNPGNDRTSCTYTSRFKNARTNAWIMSTTDRGVGTDGEGDGLVNRVTKKTRVND
jgi:hypothetical protein